METVGIEKTTSDQLKLLKKWKGMAQDQAWLHDECSKHFLILNYFMQVPVIFSSMSSGAVNLTGLKACSENNVNYTAISLGVVALLTAGLSTLQTILKFGERSNLHKQSSKEFEALSRTIAVECLLNETTSKTFVNLGQFVKDCNENFTLIMDRSQQVPTYIYKRLLKMKVKKENGSSDNSSEDRFSLDIMSAY